MVLPFSIAFIHSWHSSLLQACKISGCLNGPVILNEQLSSGSLSTMSMAANGRLPFSFSWMIINFVLRLWPLSSIVSRVGKRGEEREKECGERDKERGKRVKGNVQYCKIMIPDPKCSPDHRLGSLLLYPLFCWSIREPLKKTVKCGLSGINNYYFIAMNKPP